MQISKLTVRLSIGILVILVLGGCISTSSEPEIDATSILSESVNIPTATVPSEAVGQNVFQQRCVNCHGEQGLGDGPLAANMDCEFPNFTERPVEVTVDDYIEIISNGRVNGACAMPPFGPDSSNPLSEDEIQRVAQYIYEFGGEGDVVADTSPQETEEAADVTPSLEETPADDTTEEPNSDEDPETPAPTNTPVEIEMFTINGSIINGTADADVPEELTVGLIILAEDPEAGADAEPIEIYSDEVQIDSEGGFTFSDIPHEGLVLSVQTTYDDIIQRANPVIVSAITADIDDFEFTIYEVTDDASDVRIETVESFVGAVTDEGLAEIIQFIIFNNTGDRIFYQPDGYSTEVSIPSGTVNEEMIAFTPIINEFIQSPPERFLRVDTDDGFVFRDTQPLFPGTSTDQIVGVYTIPYAGRLTVTQKFYYTVDELVVNSSETLDLQLESDQLTPAGATTFQSAPYNSYVGEVPFPINTDLVYRIEDGPNSPNSGVTATQDIPNPHDTDEEESFLQENSSFILGFGVFLIVAGSIYLFYDLQKTRILSQSGRGSYGNSGMYQSEDDLIEAIAELDDAFEKGELDEDDYERQRAKLKDRLVKIRLGE